MNFNNIAVIAWLQGDQVKMRIGCPKHMAEGVRVESGGREGMKILLVCGAHGCPLGEWDNQETMQADLQQLEDRVKSAHLDPPKKRAS